MIESRLLEAVNETLAVILPHPSGRNLLWNDPSAIQRARALLDPLLKSARAAHSRGMAEMS